MSEAFEQIIHSDDDDDDEGNDYDEFQEDLLDNNTVGDVTDADDISSDTSSNDDDDDEEEGDEQALEAALEHDLIQMQDYSRSPSVADNSNESMDALPAPPEPLAPAPAPGSAPPSRPRSPSPAQNRRKKLKFTQIANGVPRSFIVEAICAIPHPVPTHALAASQCMTHLITGSEDGIIRDYDVFTAVNGKNFLTAPQRQHCGVVEGIMKAGHLRYWWEASDSPPGSDSSPSPTMSLAIHSDALWALSGSQQGQINLYTVRHDPGRIAHVFSTEHRGPVSALCIDHGEKSFFSGGWDGDAIHWDLNTGTPIRRFTAYGSQLVSAALRPENGVNTTGPTPMDITTPEIKRESGVNEDSKSEGSYDPLFDDEEDTSLFGELPSTALNLPGTGPPTMPPKASLGSISAPRNAPPLFDQSSAPFSLDVLMTAYIDGQVLLWDRRVQTAGTGVARLWMSEKTPPWCLSACWSTDGSQIYAGRRNGTIDIWDLRCLGKTGPGEIPKLVKTLRNPASSGVVSCVVAFPDARHIACASVDNIRLWNAAEAGELDSSMKPKSGVQFKIIPGHHGGYISQMLVDPGCRFLISSSSNRGWPYGDSTRTVFVHDIKPVQ